MENDQIAVVASLVIAALKAAKLLRALGHAESLAAAEVLESEAFVALEMIAEVQ